MKRILTLLICAFSVTLSLLAQGFSGSGSGTETDPYRIFNADQLNQVRNFLNNSDVYFSLEADIDLAPWLAENNPYEGWQPIGTSSSPFKGMFNGNGHTISNLTINRPSTDYVGLFGYCSDGAIIENTTLAKCSIIGNYNVGGIVGCYYTNTINNDIVERCNVTGNISGGVNVGGVIGGVHIIIFDEEIDSNDALSKVHNCSFSGKCMGKCVGGIVGYVRVYSGYSCTVAKDGSGYKSSGNVVTTSSGDAIRFSLDSCFVNAQILSNSIGGGCVGYADLSLYHNERHIWNKYGDDENLGDNLAKHSCCASISNSIFIGRVRCGSSGGIIGAATTESKTAKDASLKYSKTSVIIDGCAAICDSIFSTNVSGGILGSQSGSTRANLNIIDCYATCKLVKAKNVAGGICGSGDVAYIDNSYSNSHLIIAGEVCGLGNNETTSSVAINNSLIASSSLNRIGSSTSNGVQGTSDENKAWVLTKMQLNDTLRTPIEGLADGTNIGLSALKLKATYQGLGWDFDDTWDIQGTETFPYLKMQTAPVYFTGTLKAGQTSLSGQCVEAGTVTVKIGDKEYSAQSNGNTWTVTVDPLQGGETAEIMVRADGKFPSYPVYADIELAGSGTADDPYLVASAEDLRGITKENAYYKLTQDIDLTQWIADNNPTGGWQPVGDDIYGVSIAELDGDGHKITGLWIDNDELENVGLFSRFNGSIKNLNVETAEDKTISGPTYVGAIAGTLRGTATACSVKGNMANGLYVGHIAGISTGHILQCYAEGTTTNSTASAYVGGLVGKTSGSISDSYTNVTINATGSNYCGGIAGYNTGTVSNSYAEGDITGYRIGGVVGYNAGSTAKISGCVALNPSLVATQSAQRVLGGYGSSAPTPAKDNYALSTMSVSVNSVPQTIYDDPLNGYAKTAEELTTQATYTSLGWTFTTPWTVYDGYTYPFFTRDEVKATSLILSQSTIELESGESITLAATLLPTNATLQTLTWTSSDETIATVTQSGVVTATAAGYAVITASTNDGSLLSASCTLNVTTGINDVIGEKGVSIITRDHTIYISGAAANATATLYDSRGAILYHGTPRAISVSQSGVYVVVIGGQRVKVCL